MKLKTITTALIGAVLIPLNAYAQWESNSQDGPRWRVIQPLQLASTILDAQSQSGDKCTSMRSTSSQLCPSYTVERHNAVFEVRGTKHRYVVAALSNISDDYAGINIEFFASMGLTLNNNGKGEFAVGAVVELLDRHLIDYEQMALRYQLDFYYQ